MGLLRFLLALCVVVTHSPLGLKVFGVPLLSGITAVQAFYVVSGFLITMVLNERPEYRDTWNFYVSRFLRLWPAYAVVAVLALTIRYDALANELASKDLIARLVVIFANATLFLQDWILFMRWDGPALAFRSIGQYPDVSSLLLVPQAWTLGVELTFYMIAPFLCRRWWTVAALFAVGLSCRALMGFLVPAGNDPWLYRFAPAEMTFFAAGGLAYFAGAWVQRAFSAAPLQVLGWIALPIVCVAILGDQIIGPIIGLEFGYYWHCIYVMNGTQLIGAVVACPLLFYATRRIKLDDWIGELSYPMYIVHVFVGGVLVARLAPAGSAYGTELYTALVILASVALVVLVVNPVNQLRARYGARNMASHATAPSVQQTLNPGRLAPVT
jgi:peptidoglycan/LPS O-acetylase OafA/YrhL